ncbi:MAG: LacI family DNA-binding transcriptional regulator [Clostridia bacterium]|nr:LacI family DNA-binding transcriptional regulator [Clostridia bacterium]
MSVTVNDVAQACGLPVSLVTRILNDETKEEERQAVWDAARRLGYSAEKDSSLNYNLGVLFTDESDQGLQHPFFANIVNSFKTRAEHRGYDLTFIGHQTPNYLEHCKRRQVDGVALVCIQFDSPDVQALLDSDFPCVTIDYQSKKHPNVSSDNTSGVKMLVDYAVSMGHRRIAFIHGHRNSAVTESRIAQFIESMKAHHLPLPDEYLVSGLYDTPSVVSAEVEKLINCPLRPTCILLPDDATYFAARQTIQAHELRVPSDISLAGYDGTRLMESLRPRLTTIFQDGAAMGREAADRLIWQVEHPDQPIINPVIVPVTLIKGDTVGWCNDW